LEKLAQLLSRDFEVRVVVEQIDLTDIAAVSGLHQRLCDQGIEIDILINHAGHGLQGPFLDATLDSALSMVQLDIASLTALTHMFTRDMRTRGRRKILLVESLLAYQGVKT
jgi:uncharacterized protein